MLTTTVKTRLSMFPIFHYITECLRHACRSNFLGILVVQYSTFPRNAGSIGCEKILALVLQLVVLLLLASRTNLVAIQIRMTESASLQ
jgi:hypothetical protein